jgi:hypothetical protein
MAVFLLPEPSDWKNAGLLPVVIRPCSQSFRLEQSTE